MFFPSSLNHRCCYSENTDIEWSEAESGREKLAELSRYWETECECVYVCAYAYIHMWLFIYVRACTCTHKYTHSVYIFAHICIVVRTHTLTHVLMIPRSPKNCELTMSVMSLTVVLGTDTQEGDISKHIP